MCGSAGVTGARTGAAPLPPRLRCWCCSHSRTTQGTLSRTFAPASSVLGLALPSRVPLLARSALRAPTSRYHPDPRPQIPPRSKATVSRLPPSVSRSMALTRATLNRDAVDNGRLRFFLYGDAEQGVTISTLAYRRFSDPQLPSMRRLTSQRTGLGKRGHHW